MSDWEVMVAAMRAEPENALTMMVAADCLDEMGEGARAEALRWLGERGLTGEPRHGKIGYAWHQAGYDSYGPGNIDPEVVTRRMFVASDWWSAGHRHCPYLNSAVDGRLALMDAYAGADLDTRAKWLRDTETGLAVFDKLAEAK